MSGFIWNAIQQEQIRQVENKVRYVKDKTVDSQSEVATLRIKVDRITLLCEALWEIIKAETGRTDIDLSSIMTDIDMSDGKLDWKNKKPAPKCIKCGRVYQKGTMNCMFCGAKNHNMSPFEKL